nr:hypothetical protein [Deltaproteobacteria bacterium]
ARGSCPGADGDGDGTPDACDPCPLDAPDDPDGDGVCTAVDRCLAGADTVDTDGDGTPDACDDWPCGAKPTGPASVVTWMTSNENVTLSNITVAAQGQLVVADAGAELTVSASYSIVDCQCTDCIDQIEIGFSPGKQACLYNGNPAGNGTCTVVTQGSQARTVTAPSTPGIHPLRFNRGNDDQCDLGSGWWDDAAPGPDRTFALVCVR